MHPQKDPTNPRLPTQTRPAGTDERPARAPPPVPHNQAGPAYLPPPNPSPRSIVTPAWTPQVWFPQWTSTSYTVLDARCRGGSLMDQNQWGKAIGLSARVPAGKGHGAEGKCKRIYNKTSQGDGQGGEVAAQIA